MGANKARNIGIELANTAYLSFLDSDDELHPLNLEEQVKLFDTDPTIGLSYVGANYTKGGKQVSAVHPMVSGHIEKFLFENLKGLGSSTSGFCVRKNVFDKIGLFDEEMSSQQDLDFLVRTARQFPINYLNDCPTIMHIDSNNRISDNCASVLNGEIQFFDKHKQRIKELGLYHHVARKLARKYALYGKDLKSAYSCLFKAVKDKPHYLYAYLYALKLPLLYFKR